ncbi:MAG: hypothetical protein IJW10_00965 [Clostridia bacterium]|nr:hypothetical protein [Clostridia bacterium]
MKEKKHKKLKIFFICLAVFVLIVLFTPFIVLHYDDGGTTTYFALTYKIVDWKKDLDYPDVEQRTRIYFFPDNLKDLDELWEIKH